MINYSGLPQRVKRIVKTYEYCIESVQMVHSDRPSSLVEVILKSGYEVKDHGQFGSIVTEDMEALMYFLKAVTKPSTREIKTALYGFGCPICGKQVSKGSNYTDLGGMRICTMCG